MYTIDMRMILAISTDKGTLDLESVVFARQKKYAEMLGELHIIVFTKGNHESVHDGSLHIYPTNSKSPWRYGWDAIRLARKLPKPDVVTVQDPFETGLVGVIVSWLLSAPLHVQIHTDFLPPAFGKHSWKNRIRVFLASFVLRRARGVRAVSNRIKESIENKYRIKAPISILPIYTDTSRFHGARHRQHPKFSASLLFVGRLESEKRVDIAVRALSRVRNLGIDAGLTIVGEGSQRTRLGLFAKEVQVADYVEFVGKQDPLPYYAEADLVLVPSTYEGYGLVIVEALAAGVPVLATNVGVAQEAGAIIAPHDSDGFAGELCALFARSELPKGRLLEYPYKSEDEYIMAYTDDILSCVRGR